jgi:two-component system sensor histidine kinase/response regulator
MSPEKTRIDRNNYNILLIDDDKLVMESFDRILSDAVNEFTIDKTTDSKYACDLIEKNQYDLVLTDVVMPEVDGFQILKKVKNCSPEAEVIVITAYGSTSSMRDAMFLGATYYLTKPINPTELKYYIFKALAKRKVSIERKNKINELERLNYTLAHDFKSSLLSIKEFTNILSRDYNNGLDSEGRLLLYRIDSNVSRMGSMIDNLMEYTKIGKIEINLENIDTDNLVREALENFKPRLKEKKIEFIIERKLPAVHFYRDGLLRIFFNLIDNSIKYSRADVKSYIKIGVSDEGVCSDNRYVHFFIEDNGIGISPESLDIIFEIFQRDNKIKKEPGDGVGLAIVKKVLASMNCSIRAESNPGEKTSFHFTLNKI